MPRLTQRAASGQLSASALMPLQISRSSRAAAILHVRSASRHARSRALPYLNITTETMVTVSDRWLDPKKQRKQLTALPLLLALLPVIQKAHDGLLAKQKTG